MQLCRFHDSNQLILRIAKQVDSLYKSVIQLSNVPSSMITYIRQLLFARSMQILSKGHSEC